MLSAHLFSLATGAAAEAPVAAAPVAATSRSCAHAHMHAARRGAGVMCSGRERAKSSAKAARNGTGGAVADEPRRPLHSGQAPQNLGLGAA